jgi:DNA-binding response OmpR family regulator
MNNPWTVLVVEDHDALRNATLNILRQADFDAVGMCCAEDVDDHEMARMYDAYLIDLNLPGEDGLSLSKRLRKAHLRANIIITSARTKLDDRVKGYESGADIYMTKPVAPEELIAALRGLISRSKEEDNAEDVLILDPRQLLLQSTRGQCKLAASEARVLLALSQAKDQTLERWQLMMQLSTDGEDISADSMQNRLSRLRQKIAICSTEGESIKALRGTGYRLCVPLIVI